MTASKTPYTPATDTNSNEYRLDCLARHYLASKSNADIRAMLEKQPELHAQLSARLNYFKPLLGAQGLLFKQARKNSFRNTNSKAATAGLKMAREVIRSKLTNSNILKPRY